jgi:hypothetical protein
LAPAPQLAAQRVAGFRSDVSGAMMLPGAAVVGLVLLLVGGFAGGPGVGLRRPELWTGFARLSARIGWRHR